MRQAALVAGIGELALIVAFFIRSLFGPFYRLPAWAAAIMSNQRFPPRRVRLAAVALTVVRGLDGAVYATSGLFLTFIGVVLFNTTSGIGTPISLVCLTAGLFCIGLVSFRVIQIQRALLHGEALIVETTESNVGRARRYGSPWGDLTSGAAARGRYMDPPSATLRDYYMQQRWAVILKAGTQIWVLRVNGHDVLYAPTLGDDPAIRRVPAQLP